MSGDIRKAFQICRGAAEALLRKATQQTDKESKRPTIGIIDVQKASRETFDAALVTAVSFSSAFQALMLVSLASLCRTTGRDGFDMDHVMAKMEALSGSVGDPQYAPPPAFGETIGLLNHLAEMNLVKLSSSNSPYSLPMTSLAVDEHTILRGLKQTSHKALTDKSLPNLQ